MAAHNATITIVLLLEPNLSKPLPHNNVRVVYQRLDLIIRAVYVKAFCIFADRLGTSCLSYSNHRCFWWLHLRSYFKRQTNSPAMSLAPWIPKPAIYRDSDRTYPWQRFTIKELLHSHNRLLVERDFCAKLWTQNEHLKSSSIFRS